MYHSICLKKFKCSPGWRVSGDVVFIVSVSELFADIYASHCHLAGYLYNLHYIKNTQYILLQSGTEINFLCVEKRGLRYETRYKFYMQCMHSSLGDDCLHCNQKIL